jgi:hypothetical protein
LICPKCGRPVAENAVICRGCDFILDTGFLGADILDEEHQLRPGLGGVDPAVFNLADAVILGNIGDDSSSFETSDSGFHLKLDQQAARLYVSGRSQAVMSPDAVIAVIDAGEKVRLTPFEKHVLRFIDGRRPVEHIRKQAGLDEAEVKTALATLADKGVVKVVGRALADAALAADFDVDTAPGVGARKNPRRVRGTLVGAVVVVGDAADQAIDDAFRTRVHADAPKLDDLQAPDDDGGGVFSMSDEDPASVGSADIESFERPTDEIRARRGASAPGPLRPGVQRPAVNTARVAGHFAAPDVSEASDGFDEFGDASSVATAVVQQPSLSDESLPPAAPRRAVTGVFGDKRSNLSDLDDFDAPQVDGLADSRVAQRPSIPGVNAPDVVAPPRAPGVGGARVPSRAPTVAPAPLPSSIDGGDSLNEAERAAMSGGVWNDDIRSTPPPRPTTRPTNVPSSGTNVRPRRELSTSLSELLNDSEEELEPTAAGVELPRRPPPARPESGEEPTAAAAPYPERPRPPPLRPAPAPAGEDEDDDGFDDVATEALETPIARPVAGNVAASIAARAMQGIRPPMARPAMADAPPSIPSSDAAPDGDLFDGDDEFGESTEGADPGPRLSQLSTGSVHRGAPPPLPPSADRSIEATAAPEPRSVDSAESLDSAMVIRPAGRSVPPKPAPPPAAPAAAPVAPPDEDDDFMVDPDATQNLPARPKSMEGRGRRNADLPASQVDTAPPVHAQDELGSRPRRPPTEDMRRKARQLFEQALKEHAAGKLGAARMNVKLATIYDATASEYQRVLDEWEERPRDDGPARSGRPEYVELYEQAQELEDDGDIDGALDALQRGMRIAPNAAAFHNRIGVILAMRKREFDRAASEIERAIALEPDNAHYRNNLGKVIARANRRRSAVAGAR